MKLLFLIFIFTLGVSKMSETLICSFCPNISFLSVQKYLTHLNLMHSHDNQIKFCCTIAKGCKKYFSNIRTFKSHVYRKHMEVVEKSNKQTFLKKSVSCKKCQKKFPSSILLLKHIKEHLKQNENILCPVQNCEKSFHVYSSYTSHLSRCHNKTASALLEELDTQLVDCDQQISNSDDHDSLDHSFPMCCANNENESPVLDKVGQENINKHLSLLMLKFQEIYMLPQSTTQKIFNDLISLHELYTEHIVATLQKELNDKSFEGKDKVLKNIFKSVIDGPFQTAFTLLATPFRRMNYYESELQFVPPNTIFLGNNQFNKPRYFEYVPILDTLKFLLSQKDVLEQVLHPCNDQSKDLFSDYSDGLYCRNHPIFSKDKQSLKIFLFCDEFEVCNPLGVHRKIHKMLAFYYVLGNIHAKYRSSTQIIQLAILVKSVDVKQFNLKQIVAPLIKDLNILAQDGIQIENKTFKGGLAFISGDNLGSNMIGGFLESFSQNVYRYCRTCLCSKFEVQSTFIDDECVKRNADNYKLHFESTEYDTKNISLFGVKFDSPFNDVTNFHVTEGLPPDISHDLLEGVVPFELSLIIGELLKLYPEQLSLPMMNQEIQMWPYGPLDVLDKPAIIPANLNCKQTAAKIWTLIRVFPLIFHRFVSENNIYWLFLLDLKEIVELSFSPCLSLEHVAYLKMKIHDHLQLFKELFPSKKLRAKQHFLIHYASHILNFGNLKCCWTLRFEAKHHYLKRLASIGNNFKHVTHTLAQRHQLYQSYCASSKKSYLKCNITLGTSKEIDIFSLTDVDREVFDYEESKIFVSYSFCKINSLKYVSDMFLITGVIDGEQKFSQIKYIVEKDGDLHFVMREYSSFFNPHAGAFVVKEDKNKKLAIIEQKALKHSYPLSSYVCGDDRCIVLKYTVV